MLLGLGIKAARQRANQSEIKYTQLSYYHSCTPMGDVGLLGLMCC